MTPLMQVVLGALAIILVSGLAGDRIGQRLRRRYRERRTLLIGIDARRNDVQLRYVKPSKKNDLVWGQEKNGTVVSDGVVQPGEGSSMTIDGSGRAYFVNRDTLRTLKVSAAGDGLETAPEDGWQVGMYAVGMHERRVAQPSGGTWLDVLAGYTPILVIVLGVVVVIGFAMLYGGMKK